MLFNGTSISVPEPADDLPQQEAQNSPATGQPSITGTAQVGEPLTADTNGIADEDGLDNAAFTHQWLADDAVISGANGNTYTLADADVGKAIRVRVSFTEDAGNEATDAVAAAPVPLTASLANTPGTYDGQNVFTFELRFSEEFSLSYTTLRDHAFTVSGGTVEKAERITHGSQHALPDHGQAGLHRGYDHRPAHHDELRRRGGHLRGRWQDAVQRVGADSQRSGPPK